MKEWEKVKAEKAKRLISETDEDVLAAEEDEEKLLPPKGLEESRTVQNPDEQVESDSNSKNASATVEKRKEEEEKEEEVWKPPTKKVPVFLLITLLQAHKLPNLIKDGEAMKCILDALLVLTKQGDFVRLSELSGKGPHTDTFKIFQIAYMNVLAHCTIITVGDPCKAEAQQYFNENLIGTLKKKLDQQPVYDARGGKQGDLILKPEETDTDTKRHPDGYDLEFETVYKTFGGKLAHLQGFVGDYSRNF
ncbi:uncharacterized protein MELLADRAFT_95163 [Melampsora larici-populina 98AG31]|uniref:Uncharacterized protein n=1 Tax=Melampsora larici-populina (strain 98AG31 / pathotype 3-4-7) TaxID=747676 RepID=F4RCD4_MELLP|nr:uncharacterized protein MELLADRAFT_95163 [Melampsora larici-populina 98AG31]EGG09979.1 hypothetical protein MELLADRAFT_95163 [Melampsora larici-populina 98AG31]